MAQVSQAFNTMLGQFLEDLQKCFPEEREKLVFVQESVNSLASMNVRKPMELFVAALNPHGALVLNKDPALFDQPIELPGGLDMAKLWHAPDVTDEHRTAIWQYVSNLYGLGAMVSSLPPAMHDLLDQMTAQLSACLNPDALAGADPGAMVGGLMSFMGSQGGAGAFANLFAPGAPGGCLPGLGELYVPPKTKSSDHKKRR